MTDREWQTLGLGFNAGWLSLGLFLLAIGVLKP